nr:gene GA protein - garden pea [Pisum sativum]
MQTALTFAATITVVPLTTPKSVSHLTIFPTKFTASRASPPRYTAIKVASGNSDPATVNYNSAFSVFQLRRVNGSEGKLVWQTCILK